MNDPTYIRDEINANPEWALAFFLSEVDNDNAPIGWYRYISMAKCLLSKYNMEVKNEVNKPQSYEANRND